MQEEINDLKDSHFSQPKSRNEDSDSQDIKKMVEENTNKIEAMEKKYQSILKEFDELNQYFSVLLKLIFLLENKLTLFQHFRHLRVKYKPKIMPLLFLIALHSLMKNKETLFLLK